MSEPLCFARIHIVACLANLFRQSPEVRMLPPGLSLAGRAKSTFKSSWFSATSDWWVDDTAEVMAVGSSGADALGRRDNLDKTWSRRPANTYWTTFYWSWQQG